MNQKRPKGQRRGKTDTLTSSASPEQDGRIDVSILVLPSVHTSALYGAYDMLSSAGLRWDQRYCNIRPGSNRFRLRMVGPSEQPIEGWNGVTVRPNAPFSDIGKTDVVYIPAFGVPESDLPPTQPAMRDWLREQYAAGAIVAAACSGSIVLAEAGLLDDQCATTHWAYAATFASRFPNTRLCAERALVLAGSEQRLVTAGGGSLWFELILYLIARLLGREAAMHTAKLYLVDWGREDQLPYALFQERLQHADGVIRKSQAYIAQHAAEPDVLAGARAASGLQERTFARRFKSVTGVSTGRYIQEVRIEMAKRAMEEGTRPIDDVACDVGYTDPASFRRLFKRMVGINPSAYRRRMTPPG